VKREKAKISTFDLSCEWPVNIGLEEFGIWCLELATCVLQLEKFVRTTVEKARRSSTDDGLGFA